MKEWKIVDDVLDFAIDREQEAHDFYLELAQQAAHESMRKTFREFAGEEAGHKARIEAVKAGKKMLSTTRTVQDLKLADYLVDLIPTPDMDYQSALVLAMKREKAAFRLYSDLAAQSDDVEVQALFEGLAQEEARHKLRFELEYDEHVLREN